MSKVAYNAPEGDSERIVISKSLTVKELSAKLRLKDSEVVKTLFEIGHIRTVHQIVELEVAIVAAKKLGFEVLNSETEI